MAEKLKPGHIDQLLKIAEQHEKYSYELRRQDQDHQLKFIKIVAYLVTLILLLGFGLCRLFLIYGKAEYVYQVITYILVGGGGVGIGTGVSRMVQRGPSRPKSGR